MSPERYVEGRLAFSSRLLSYVDESVSVDTSRLMNLMSAAGFKVKALDVSIVTKDVDAASDQQS